MKKWVGILIALVLFVLIGMSCITGNYAANQASFGVIHNNGEYVSQVIQSEDKDFVIYQNVQDDKFQIVNTDKDLKEFQTVGTVHQKEVYFLFQYKENQKQIWGIEPLGLKNTEKWATPTFEAEGTFLAIGSTEKEIFASILGTDQKTITEYTISLDEPESTWTERKSFRLSDEHSIRLAAYDKEKFIFQQEDGNIFCSDVVVQKIRLEDTAVLVTNVGNHLMQGAENTWRIYSVILSMDRCFVPSLILAILVVLILYGLSKKEPIMYRVLCFTEAFSSLCFIIVGYIIAAAVLNENMYSIEDKTEKVLIVKMMVYILLMVTTLIHGFALFALSCRWKKFTKAMEYVATEKKAYAEIPTEDDGMQMVWSPLDTIGKSIAKINYEKEVLYKSYYRFVPKGMEMLLNKQQMEDVSIGDHNTINGCMVYFSIDNIKDYDVSQYMSVMTDSLQIMHKVRQKHDGIFHSAGSDLLERKVFFEKNPEAALPFAVDLIHAYAENGSLKNIDYIFMLHLSNYYYGISGIDDMMTPFIFCKEEKILEPYVNALAKAKVKIALTERTLALIGNVFSVRYIGFISDKKLGNIKIYECLDAYTEVKRAQLEASNETFQNALNLFYSNDFYLARNAFNDVLKTNEQDQIARWYLFHCEYHLNNPEAEIEYGLFGNID